MFNWRHQHLCTCRKPNTSQSQQHCPSKKLRSSHRDEPPVRESTSRPTPMLQGTGDCRVNFCSRHSLAAESEKKSEAARNEFLAAILPPDVQSRFFCLSMTSIEPPFLLPACD